MIPMCPICETPTAITCIGSYDRSTEWRCLECGKTWIDKI